jgi:hypothetical protein
MHNGILCLGGRIKDTRQTESEIPVDWKAASQLFLEYAVSEAQLNVTCMIT